MDFLQQLKGLSCLMLPGVYHLVNFWNLAFPIMQLQVGWPVVVILSTETASGSMGEHDSYFFLYF
jgi:hypothetical protein